MIIIKLIVLIFLTCYSFALGSIPSNEVNAFGAMMGMLFFVFTPVLYLLPTYEAWKAGKVNLTSIALVNILLGWSLIGWAVALIWACAKDGSDSKTENYATLGKPKTVWEAAEQQRIDKAEGRLSPMTQATKKCPECAEQVLVEARKCKHCGSAI